MDDRYKFTSQRRILKPSKDKSETPLKHLLKLPKRLRDKIIRKSSSMWKYPFGKMTAKRTINDNKENDDTSVKRSRHDESKQNPEYKEISMAVIHTKYPESDLTIKQADLIERNIKDAMKYAREPYRSKLNIIEMDYKEGIFYIKCGNHTTVNWMWETVHSVGDIRKGMLLRVIESRYLPYKPKNMSDLDNFNISGLLRF